MTPFRERLRIAWDVLRGRPITYTDDMEITRTSVGVFHANVSERPDGSYQLLDNCSPPCDAQEARALGGEIWERYAMDIAQRAGSRSIERG
jgi:hypothetical protein